MNFLIGIVVFLLALIFSGILYLVGLVQVTPVPYNIWLITSMGLFFALYKLKFKNKRVLKFFFLRKWLEFNSWFYQIDKKMTVGHYKIDAMQERCLKLWKVSLKDKNCVLRCSISTRERFVESGNILMILKPTGADHHILDIYDSNQDTRCNFYEVIVPQPHLQNACDQFDSEMNRRMFQLEADRKEIIEDTIETMLRRHEDYIKSKKV